MLMYFGVINTGYATSFFIPTIVLELKPGTTSAEALERANEVLAYGDDTPKKHHGADPG